MAVIDARYCITQIKNNIAVLTGAAEDDIKVVTLTGDDNNQEIPGPVTSYRAAIVFKSHKDAVSDEGSTGYHHVVIRGSEMAWNVIFQSQLTAAQSVEEVIRDLMNDTAELVRLRWLQDYRLDGVDSDSEIPISTWGNDLPQGDWDTAEAFDLGLAGRESACGESINSWCVGELFCS